MKHEFTTLVCDVCGRKHERHTCEVGKSPSAELLRFWARTDGWFWSPMTGDECPDCSAGRG